MSLQQSHSETNPISLSTDSHNQLPNAHSTQSDSQLSSRDSQLKRQSSPTRRSSSRSRSSSRTKSDSMRTHRSGFRDDYLSRRNVVLSQSDHGKRRASSRSRSLSRERSSTRSRHHRSRDLSRSRGRSKNRSRSRESSHRDRKKRHRSLSCSRSPSPKSKNTDDKDTEETKRTRSHRHHDSRDRSPERKRDKTRRRESSESPSSSRSKSKRTRNRSSSATKQSSRSPSRSRSYERSSNRDKYKSSSKYRDSDRDRDRGRDRDRDRDRDRERHRSSRERKRSRHSRSPRRSSRSPSYERRRRSRRSHSRSRSQSPSKPRFSIVSELTTIDLVPKTAQDIKRSRPYREQAWYSRRKAMQWLHRNNNPHCEQLLLDPPNGDWYVQLDKKDKNYAKQVYNNYFAKDIDYKYSREHVPAPVPFSRVLQDDDPELKYLRRKNMKKTVLHWGQRKLLLSEIEFLTLYAHDPTDEELRVADLIAAIDKQQTDPSYPLTLSSNDTVHISNDFPYNLDENKWHLAALQDEERKLEQKNPNYPILVVNESATMDDITELQPTGAGVGDDNESGSKNEKKGKDVCEDENQVENQDEDEDDGVLAAKKSRTHYSYYENCPTIMLYAGAAPGTHISLLVDMYPGVYFVLVDPNEFDLPLKYISRYYGNDERYNPLSSRFGTSFSWSNAQGTEPRVRGVEERMLQKEMVQRERENGVDKNLYTEAHYRTMFQRPFAGRKRIEIRNCFFTNEIAEEFYEISQKTGARVLFVSDIRTASWEDMSDTEVEKRVEADMDLQALWVKISKPHSAMLKFRLPWDLQKKTYLSGRVHLPVFGPQTTSETRLVTYTQEEREKYNIPLEVEWDCAKYESQCFYFNTNTRVMCFPHPIIYSRGLDHCYDCTSEIFILANYIYSRHFRSESPGAPGAVSSVSTSSRYEKWENILMKGILNSFSMTKDLSAFSKQVSHESFACLNSKVRDAQAQGTMTDLPSQSTLDGEEFTPLLSKSTVHPCTMNVKKDDDKVPDDIFPSLDLSTMNGADCDFISKFSTYISHLCSTWGRQLFDPQTKPTPKLKASNMFKAALSSADPTIKHIQQTDEY